jgi:hypothetical protein
MMGSFDNPLSLNGEEILPPNDEVEGINFTRSFKEHAFEASAQRYVNSKAAKEFPAVKVSFDDVL